MKDAIERHLRDTVLVLYNQSGKIEDIHALGISVRKPQDLYCGARHLRRG